MKQMLRKRFPTIENSALMILMLHPALLWLLTAAFPEVNWLYVPVELGCLLIGLVIRWLPVKRHALLCAAVDMALLCVLALTPFTMTQKVLLAPFVLPVTFIVFRVMDGFLNRSYLVAFFYTIGVYVVTLILIRAGVYPADKLSSLSVGAALVIPVGLGVINRCSVQQTLQVHTGVTATARINAGNRFMAYVFSALILIAACFREIQRFCQDAIEWLKRIVSIIVDFIMSLVPIGTEEITAGDMGEQGDMFADLVEDTAPSPFWVFLEHALQYVAYLVIAALAIFAVWIVFKKLSSFVRKWFKTIQDRLSMPDDDYQDEAVSLLSSDDDAERKKARRSRRASKPRSWNEMDDRERVRYVGGLIMAKKRPRPSDTARRLLEDENAPLTYVYEAARYSAAPVPPQASDIAQHVYEQIHK